MKIKFGHIAAIAAAVLLSATKVSAQEYKTDVSVSKQVINGSVPGAQYAPAKPKRVTPLVTPGDGKETIRTQFKNQKLIGMPYAKGGSVAPKKVLNRNTANAAKLPSASSAPVAKKQTIVATPLPTQGDAVPTENTPLPVKEKVVPTKQKSGAAKQ